MNKERGTLIQFSHPAVISRLVGQILLGAGIVDAGRALAGLFLAQPGPVRRGELIDEVIVAGILVVVSLLGYLLRSRALLWAGLLVVGFLVFWHLLIGGSWVRGGFAVVLFGYCFARMTSWRALSSAPLWVGGRGAEPRSGRAPVVPGDGSR